MYLVIANLTMIWFQASSVFELRLFEKAIKLGWRAFIKTAIVESWKQILIGSNDAQFLSIFVAISVLQLKWQLKLTIFNYYQVFTLLIEIRNQLTGLNLPMAYQEANTRYNELPTRNFRTYDRLTFNSLEWNILPETPNHGMNCI